MSSIDERVVGMKFDNAQFERGVKTTLDSLSALNKGLKLQGATKGLEEVSTAANRLSLSNIAAGVDHIASKFNSLTVIAVSALSKITTSAVEAGNRIVKSITFQPIIDGLHEYETNLNSIQTILSNTQWEGAGLDDVNEALQQLNHYSDQTIYNFSEMARNIGTFTAAGVKLDTSVNAIKGIANLAAISGSSAMQASTAMYQLSQALATGTVKLMDWNSVVNAGMGGKVFQDALKETARVHGVAVDQIIKDEGSFRDSLQKGWLTSEILTETLAKFTGDLTASQLKAMGYNDQQIAGILKMGKTAQDAATKIKTFSQLLSTLQEAAGSGWSQTWQLIFGNFEEAKDLFSGVYNVLGGFITASANARNKVLADWKELGGRKAIIEAIANAFNALVAVVRPIKDAFREIFPAKTGKQLAEFSFMLRDFTAGLKIGADTANNLKRTFAGVFAIFDIGFTIVKKIAGVLIDLFSTATKGSGGFLETTASVGDFLVALDKAIKNGEKLNRFFEKLTDVLEKPIVVIRALISYLAKAFSNVDDIGGPALDKLQERFSPLGKIGDAIIAIWSRIGKTVKGAWNAFRPIAEAFHDFFENLGQTVEKGFGDINYNSVLDSINTGLFAGLVLILRKFLKNGFGVDIGGGFLEKIGNSFDELTGTLHAMQTSLKANTLIKIAGAIALLTASVVALSLIDSAKLTSALAAMAGMFTELMTAMLVFEKLSGFKGFAKMPFVAASMILLAAAVDVLTIAVANLARLNWEELARGLTGLTVILGALIGAVTLMPDDKKLISAGLGMIALAVAIHLLVSAVTDLSGLSWEEMAKGLTGTATLLAALALFTKFAAADKAGVLQGAGIILLATGIKILASAMQDFAGFSWGEIAKGLTSMAAGLTLMAAALIAIPPSSLFSAAAVLVVAASLGMVSDALGEMGKFSWGSIAKGLTSLGGALFIIATALNLFPPTTLLSAAAVLVVAASLGMISDALDKMGGMSWESIAKGLITLAGSLGIIAVAMFAMTGALPGAAALLVVAASLRILQPVLQAFGDMSLMEMGKSLLYLAGVFVVLGAAGLVLTPLVPTLIGLGIAVTLLGVGMLAAGAGVLAFAAGLTALSIAGAAGAAAIVGIVSALVGLIPMVMKEIGMGIVAFAQVIATAGPAITAAITTVLLSLIAAIVKLTPAIVKALFNLLVMLLEELAKAVPKMVTAGLKLLTGILRGIADNIGKVVDAATDIIINFLKALQRNQPKIVDEGAKTIISFIHGVADAIRKNSKALGEAGGDLASAIVEGMVKGLAGGAGKIASQAKSVAKSALNAAKNVLGISSPSKEFMKLGQFSDEGMALGIKKFSHVVEKSSENVGKAALKSLKMSISNLGEVVSKDIDVNPTITPVLDLTKIKKDAGSIGTILSYAKPISVGATISSANAAAVGQQSNQTTKDDQSSDDPRELISFTQNNYSPKALSAADIYRQTKNQISKAKGVLTP